MRIIVVVEPGDHTQSVEEVARWLRKEKSCDVDVKYPSGRVIKF